MHGKELVTDSKEMAPDSPEFATMLASSKAETSKVASPVADNTGVKDPSLSPEEGKEDDVPETIEAAQKRIKGLEAELKRRRGQADKVNELTEQIEYLRGTVETLSKARESGNESPLQAAIAKLSDDELISKEVDYNEELQDARSRYNQAIDRGDDERASRELQRINYAKQVISSLRLAQRDRAVAKTKAEQDVANESNTIRNELQGMYDAVTELAPDFAEEGSELWNAGKAEFDANPVLMARLGPAGEVVAAAMAIVKHPELITTKARKQVLDSIDKGLNTALRSGAPAPRSNRGSAFNIETQEGVRDFEAYVSRVKGG